MPGLFSPNFIDEETDFTRSHGEAMAGGRHSNPGGESGAAHPLAVRPACNMGPSNDSPAPSAGAGEQRAWLNPTHEALTNPKGSGP